MMRRAFLVGCCLLTAIATAQEGSSPSTLPLAAGAFHLTVTAYEVSLEAQDASVAAIVAAIGQRTGIPTVIYPGVDERVTIHLTRVALGAALKQVTPNVVIRTALGPDAPPHRIAKVYVFAKGQARPPQRAGAPAPQAETAPDTAARPAPFQFTFDPSQHMQPSQ
jgi:hypothetical protein